MIKINLNKPKIIQKVPYCPKNGCYMINGAAPENLTICDCGEKYKAIHSKLCPKCHHCPVCKRIGKNFYQK